MPFPNVERVIYKRNPLEQVICQLRFPTILRIDSEIPASFQEDIRAQYPFFEEKVGLPTQPPPELVEKVPTDVMNLLFHPRKAYEFRSENAEWTISLTKDFIALSCHHYVRWEEFRSYLEKPVEALVKFYSPAFFSRVGLRYQNVIRRSALDLGGMSWGELLKPYISAELGLVGIAESVDEAMHSVVFKLEEHESRVRMQHGLAQHLPDMEFSYLIDNDFFTEQRTEIADVWRTLEYFNSGSRRLFRWCIEDKLHTAMGPQSV